MWLSLKGHALRTASNADAIALNRVIGGNLSEIHGLLKADGQVFLLNPQGVLFGEDATVDVAGLVASSLMINDVDFLVGDYSFVDLGGAGGVTNLGRIMAGRGEDRAGGYVALLAPQVQNDGSITAYLGTVALGVGGAARLEMEGGRLVGLAVDQEAAEAYLSNQGTITADGGVVLLEARAHEAPLRTVVNQGGAVRARGALTRDGRIVLSGVTFAVVSDDLTGESAALPNLDLSERGIYDDRHVGENKLVSVDLTGITFEISDGDVIIYGLDPIEDRVTAG